jgi:S-formylglutathione hydrolase FrmB
MHAFTIGRMKTLITAFVAASLALSVMAASNAGHYERISVHGPSLAGNLAGDPADRQVSVYLPASYAKQPKRRYPVVYLLHGFTDNDAQWFGQAGKHFVHVPNAVDATAVNAREMIVVMPNAFTKFAGSMYSNSVVVGDWETFVARDLVAYVDSHYRTLAKPASRGLAGHSMGGYGTLRVAMKAPGVFSAFYAMSPCCLAASPQPDTRMFVRAAEVRTHEEIAAVDFLSKAMLASAAAWSPNPTKPPLYIDLPVVDGKPVPEVAAAWAANAPVTMLHQYIPALKTYRAIAIDSGDKDAMIAPASRQLHELLDRYSIAHDFEIYDGDHLNRIERRLTDKVLPFFATHLEMK